MRASEDQRVTVSKTALRDLVDLARTAARSVGHSDRALSDALLGCATEVALTVEDAEYERVPC